MNHRGVRAGEEQLERGPYSKRAWIIPKRDAILLLFEGQMLEDNLFHLCTKNKQGVGDG